jgi:GntR family transcriptional repressor for pyruvate dehydrogenase complex
MPTSLAPGSRAPVRGERSAHRLLEADVLEILAGAKQPMGSSQLQEQLGHLGHDVSEPTVGRLLTRLDRQRLTVRVSNRGRVVTNPGRRFVEKLGRERQWRFFEDQFLNSMQTSTLREIEDLLVARRAIERETARLAALNATADDIKRLRSFLDQQTPEQVKPGLHDIVASIGGNRVLAAALALISNSETLHQRLRAVLKAEDVLFDAAFHKRLVDAVSRHDADGAEKAMTGHVDRMLEAVRHFAQRRPEVTRRAASATKRA